MYAPIESICASFGKQWQTVGSLGVLDSAGQMVMIFPLLQKGVWFPGHQREALPNDKGTSYRLAF